MIQRKNVKYKKERESNRLGSTFDEINSWLVKKGLHDNVFTKKGKVMKT